MVALIQASLAFSLAFALVAALSPWLSRADISRLKRVEDALERLSNSGRFPHTLRLLEEQYTPFALFEKAGGIAAAHLPLDEYINALYDLFSAQTDKTALREAMVKDRLSSNATGILPGRLQIPEPKLRRYKMALQRLDPAPAGVRRGMAMLYSSRQLVYVDYGLADPVSGRYPLKFIKIEDLKK